MCRIQCLLWWTSEARDNPMWANFGELCCVVCCVLCVLCLVSCVVVCCVTRWKKPVCPFKTPACEHSKRPRVHRGTTRTCWNTCARGAGIQGDVFERTHGDVLDGHTGVLIGHTTPPWHHDNAHTPQHTTHHNTQHTRQHTTQPQHNITHNNTRWQRQREKEKTEKERREDERRGWKSRTLGPDYNSTLGAELSY